MRTAAAFSFEEGFGQWNGNRPLISTCTKLTENEAAPAHTGSEERREGEKEEVA